MQDFIVMQIIYCNVIMQKGYSFLLKFSFYQKND